MQQIRFAVVGLGRIGMRHVAMIEGNPAATLVAVCDILSQAEIGWERIEIPFYQSIDRLVAAQHEIDVLCVATPNSLHAPQAIIALEAGYHVLIEKPMALHKADCEEILFKALEASRKVFCVMQNRYSPPATWLKSVLEQGLLGQIFMVQTECFWNRDARYYTPKNWHGTQELDGGTLFTQFSHFVDMLYWLFGDVRNLKARFFDFNHQHLTDFEDSGQVLFDFVKGGAGVLSYSTAIWQKNFESSLTVIAEKGTVKIGGQYMNEVVYCNIEGYQMPELPPSAPPNQYGLYQGSAANHHFVYQNVIDTLHGKASIATNALEGMKVVEIIERIYAQKKAD